MCNYNEATNISPTYTDFLSVLLSPQIVFLTVLFNLD
jgi:hypothetical protein